MGEAKRRRATGTTNVLAWTLEKCGSMPELYKLLTGMLGSAMVHNYPGPDIPDSAIEGLAEWMRWLIIEAARAERERLSVN
jgi:hypothetical protein